tara:strand:- start:67 stop:255 length:189 start_codon:yes stop_codon:yes gene_type:complete
VNWITLLPTARLWQVGQQGNLFVSVCARSQSFLFCNYFHFSIAKSKRFGGLRKHAQANIINA